MYIYVHNVCVYIYICIYIYTRVCIYTDPFNVVTQQPASPSTPPAPPPAGTGPAAQENVETLAPGGPQSPGSCPQSPLPREDSLRFLRVNVHRWKRRAEGDAPCLCCQQHNQLTPPWGPQRLGRHPTGARLLPRLRMCVSLCWEVSSWLFEPTCPGHRQTGSPCGSTPRRQPPSNGRGAAWLPLGWDSEEVRSALYPRAAG